MALIVNNGSLSKKMAHIVTQNTTNREDWLYQLANAITDPDELLRALSLQDNQQLLGGHTARHLFSLRVPRTFVARMHPGDPNDPLLRQVLTCSEELLNTPGFTHDPLNEQCSTVPGLLHKYHNRVLLLVKSGCAVHCRYCFRRHFPYKENQSNKTNWPLTLKYLQQHTELDEIILSGGDPLMAKDYELDWLMAELEAIPHIKRLRIHTRLPVVIPSRITTSLCQRFSSSRLQILLVTHINHPNEIDHSLSEKIVQLRQSGVTLLNQSVLLRGVNDDAEVLAILSNRLFDIGILPYYLHVLDKVQGAAHFMVDDNIARDIIRGLLNKVSGYLVPKLVREIGGAPSKIPLDLHLNPK